MSKLLVMSLFRDSEDILAETLKNFESIEELDMDVEFAFYENDSVDNTRSILTKWIDGRGKVFFEDLGFPRFGSVPDVERLIFMSYYRNSLKRKYGITNADFVLLVDSDVRFDRSHVKMLLERIPGYAMMTSNTRQVEIPDLMYGETSDSFYDVFAVRDRYFNNGLYFTDCPVMVGGDRKLWAEGKIIDVTAAFGGLALIYGNVFNQVEWSTSGHVEHINFCAEVGTFGKIGIDPLCKPVSPVDMSKINLDACRQIAQRQVQAMSNINNIIAASTSNTLKVQ
jgi:hypothetical protein